MRGIFSTALLFAFAVLGDLSSASALAMAPSAEPKFTKLESVSDINLCGETVDRKTACLASSSRLFVPDTVTKLTHIFSNDTASCGLDTEGLKCWAISTTDMLFEGKAVEAAVRDFYRIVKPDSVDTSANNVCGVVAATGELYCLLPTWYRQPDQVMRVKPLEPIVANATAESTVCWAEGTPQFSTIQCRSHGWGAVTWPRNMGLSQLTQLVAGEAYACARSNAEAKCWSDAGEVSLPTELVTAKVWSADSQALCALTSDHVVTCIDPSTGKIAAARFGRPVPSDFQTPNPDVKDFWSYDAYGCALMVDGSVNCWQWWTTNYFKNKFSGKVAKLAGSSYNPCAILENGQAECRGDTHESRSLNSTDRLRVELGGYQNCFWNSTGIDCRSRYDDINYRSVKAVASSTSDENLCIIGQPQGSKSTYDSVQCFTSDPVLSTPRTDLTNPTHIAATSRQVCTHSDEGVICWGEPFQNSNTPTSLVDVSKFVMADKHACAIDRLGLVCWGDLADQALEIPAGLNGRRVVIDVAVGDGRTCAILNTGVVQCWGSDPTYTGPPPDLVGATSIVGRHGQFCALDTTGVHCWGGSRTFPQ